MNQYINFFHISIKIIYFPSILTIIDYRIKEPLNCIVDMCSEVSKNKFLLAYYELHELLVDLPQSQLALAKNKDQIRAYGTKTFVLLDEGFIKASDIVLQNYSSFFSGEGFFIDREGMYYKFIIS